MDILRKVANNIIDEAIKSVQPDAAVKKALQNTKFNGRIFLVAVGKAAWQMAKAASEVIGDKIKSGIVITKYNHTMGEIPKCKCFEAGHPVPDENSFIATRQAIDLVSDLSKNDTVLFLLSGGGSALFEKSLIEAEELQDITSQLLASGADIVEINTIRKRLSEVKGGRFANICKPAKVLSIVLSDIIGDPLDMIASGPTAVDNSTCDDALKIIKKYSLKISDKADKLLRQETPKTLDNVETHINGSVRELCLAAYDVCQKHGYEPFILTDMLCCQAKEAGSFLSSIVQTHINDNKKLAFIAGGETIVKLTGKGKGGRNQEIALSAAKGISGLNAAVFSIGSDGTDGPTDAAGGYVDKDSYLSLVNKGIDVEQVLANNDAYNALKEIDGLIITGPTGTNVNDVAVALIN